MQTTVAVSLHSVNGITELWISAFRLLLVITAFMSCCEAPEDTWWGRPAAGGWCRLQRGTAHRSPSRIWKEQERETLNFSFDDILLTIAVISLTKSSSKNQNNPYTERQNTEKVSNFPKQLAPTISQCEWLMKFSFSVLIFHYLLAVVWTLFSFCYSFFVS